MTDRPHSAGKAKGWLKNALTARTQSYRQAEFSSEAEIQSSLAEHPASEISLLDQDKAALDLVVAVENLLNDRQLIHFKSKDIEQQLANANEDISRLKNDLMKKEQLIADREQEFRLLEDKLTAKQMGYDQLLEDYKEFQNASNSGIDNLKYQLEKERNKYAKLHEDSHRFQQDSLQRTKELEEKLRDAEAENLQLASQYQKVTEEKTKLLQSVTDFTARMAFSLSPPSE